MVDYSERLALITDCLTMCKNIGLCMDILDLDSSSRLLTAGTGLKFTPERVDEILKNHVVMDRLLNIEFGLESAQDTLPARFTQEPLEAGPSKGGVVDIGRMVKEYYEIKGWDEKGNPQ